MTLTEIKDIWVGNSRLLPGSTHGVPPIAMNAGPARQPVQGAAGSHKPGQKEKKGKKKKKILTLRKRGTFFLIVLWTVRLFILAFCCISPLPFHTPAAASESRRWWPYPTAPPLPDLQVGLGLVGELQHVWRVWCATQRAATGDGSGCSDDHDPREGRVKPTICWRTESPTLDVGRVVVSPKDKHLALMDKIFWSGWWLISCSKCFQPLTDMSE